MNRIGNNPPFIIITHCANHFNPLAFPVFRPDFFRELNLVVSDNLVQRFSAGKLVGDVAKKLGGGGGGKAHLATAGAKDASKIQETLKEFIQQF